MKACDKDYPTCEDVLNSCLPNCLNETSMTINWNCMALCVVPKNNIHAAKVGYSDGFAG